MTILHREYMCWNDGKAHTMAKAKVQPNLYLLSAHFQTETIHVTLLLIASEIIDMNDGPDYGMDIDSKLGIL